MPSGKFHGGWVLFFQVEAFQFFKFHEDVVKLDKGKFNRDLIVTFKVKNL